MAQIKPTDLPLCRTRGDTFPHTFALKDSAGSAIDITGFTFLMTVDPSEEPTDATGNLFQLTGVITNAAGGLFQFAPTTVQANQTPNEYYYDVQMVDGSGALRTILKSTYTFTQDITK